MAKYEDGSYGSAAGIALIAKVLAGRCAMKYTRVAVGKGNIPDDKTPKTMTEPADYVMDAVIAGITNPVDGECQVTVQINSANVDKGFYCTAVVLYAEDPDEGEVPYTYLVLENEPEWIRPASSIVGKLATIDLIAAVGDVDTVTAAIDPEAIATVAAVNDLLQRHNEDPEAHAGIIMDAVGSAMKKLEESGQIMDQKTVETMILYQRHQRYILNPDFRRIADTIIDTAPGEFPGRGMPLGVEPSQQEMAAMPSAVDNWIKCQMSTHSAGHYMDDYCIILPDIEDLKNLGRAIVRQFEIRGIPVNKKKCKIIPLTKPFRWCKARFTLTETGKIKVNGSRDGVIRARRKLKLFHREWLAGKRTLQEVAQYMNCQEAYYKNFDDHGRLLRLRRLCYAIFGGRVPCSKSSKPVMAPSLP